MKNVLLYKLLVVNATIASWIGYTNFKTQWLQKMLLQDSTYTAAGIAGAFAIVTAGLMFKALRINATMNRLKVLGRSEVDPRKVKFVGEQMMIELDFYNKTATWFFILGMIGTLMGVAITLEGVTETSFASLEGYKLLATKMLLGLRTELPATIIGAFAGLWMEFNYQMTKTPAELMSNADGLEE